jgi:hypothetical protein
VKIKTKRKKKNQTLYYAIVCYPGLPSENPKTAQDTIHTHLRQVKTSHKNEDRTLQLFHHYLRIKKDLQSPD